MGIVKLALGGLLALSFALAYVGSAMAESFDLSADQGAQVSPVIIELNAEPGKSYTLDVNVMNVTGTDLTYGTEFFDFRAGQDESGSPEISEDNTLPKEASIRSWLTAEGEFSLASHQKQSLKVKVDVPQNAEPGGHYGVIAFTGKVPTGEGQRVSVKVKTGILVLIRVAGDIKESLQVASFTTDSKNKTPWFIETAPIDFTVRLQNTGNVHVKPTGTIEVRNMFGGLVDKATVNQKNGNVLPDSIRKFTASINKDWMIGPYTADLTLGYGTTGQALTSQTTFWVVPYKPLLALLALLITLIFIIRRILRAYKKRIITEAEEAAHEHDQDQTEAQKPEDTVQPAPAPVPTPQVEEPIQPPKQEVTKVPVQDVEETTPEAPVVTESSAAQQQLEELLKSSDEKSQVESRDQDQGPTPPAQP